ncbi:hypothetical protein [uncultured Jatrophihabitans sp.]|uniref:hypothetical protein n=1 Tax=uncultured Jatrophihabitans sp. TaxID=1610747 RepID=UPI0035C9C9EE
MSLLPNPDTLLAVAGRIARHAAALRRHAELLAASLGHTTWHGAAARSFAHEALEVCASLRRSAERLDSAAAALRQHAARVRGELTVLSRATTGALHTAGVGVHVAGDVAHEVLDVVGI